MVEVKFWKNRTTQEVPATAWEEGGRPVALGKSALTLLAISSACAQNHPGDRAGQLGQSDRLNRPSLWRPGSKSCRFGHSKITAVLRPCGSHRPACLTIPAPAANIGE